MMWSPMSSEKSSLILPSVCTSLTKSGPNQNTDLGVEIEIFFEFCLLKILHRHTGRPGLHDRLRPIFVLMFLVGESCTKGVTT